jgi:hypothetical protein
MINKPKFGKIALVVFLTILIWVWADLAQDDKVTLSDRITIGVAPSSDQTSWILFQKEENKPLQLRVTLDSVDLKGPVKNTAEVRRMQERGTLDLALYLDPKQAGLEGNGRQKLDVLSFLKNNDQMKHLGMTVENCEPRMLIVQVQQLIEKPVTVQCVDANDHVLAADLDPATVKALVPGDDVRTATIRLSATDQQQAKASFVWKNPFVELAPGQPRNVSTRVKVRLSSQEEALTEFQIHPILGFCMSTNLQGKYQVLLQNEADFASIFIQATKAARDAFEKQEFPIVLNILDADKQTTDVQEREVAFNFPQEYLLKREIRPGRTPPPKAKFKIVPIAPDTKPTAPR